jgi:lipid-binding SYLF domain-containing protein
MNMKKYDAIMRTFLIAAFAVGGLVGAQLVAAADTAKLEQDARASLNKLYSENAGAKALGAKAKGILVFPDVVKAGLIVGGQGGDGVLLVNNKRAGVYNTAAISVGLQAGAQSYGYALFFMTDAVLKSFMASKNFEIGVGPNIVVIDAGAAKDISTLTAQADVYAVIFDQKGLMAGIGIVGSKITKLDR